MPALSEFDYIIVGGGSAGCVLARRLSDDPQVSVLLLERGSRYPRHTLAIPLVSKRFIGKYLEMIETSPQAFCGGRRIACPIARVLGGGSAVNSMIYIRGQPEAYDRWERMGALGWGFQDVLPYFRRLEDFEGPPGPWHGHGGPVAVSATRFRAPFGAAFLGACYESGIPANEDLCGERQDGAGWYWYTQRDGSRSSTASAYLEPVAGRPNLTVWTHAEAHRIELEGLRARSVSGYRRRVPFTARAVREIVLTAGALGSPRLLLLSGIGPAEELSNVGIRPVHDLTGVGKGLQDHPRCSVLFQTSRPVSLRLPSLAVALVRWGLRRDGLLTSPSLAAGAFLQVGSGSLLDCQLVATWTIAGRNSTVVGIHPTVMEVESRGSLRLISSNPGVAPAVDPAYLATSHDRTILREGIRIARALARTRSFEQFDRLEEVSPGPGVESDHDLTRFLESSIQTAFHPACTCSMGQGPETVVDPELRVHGVDGLRIADASVMPRLINGNTNGPTIMIAERAADLIRTGNRIP